ncbi:MAG: hypothetical protein EXS42_05010 [Lacunisphaera sp.]|nr:hypothetical protein [Lacunisphaera sp.]
MKYLWGTLTVLVLVAAATGFVSYRLSCEPALHAAVVRGDTSAWLRTDFHLNDRQFAEIKELHKAYAPSCEEHCRLIQVATKTRDDFKATGGADPAAATAAEHKLQELRTTCETALTAHVRKVAMLMTPEDGSRYLALVLPKIAGFDHTAAPDLHLGHPH